MAFQIARGNVVLRSDSANQVFDEDDLSKQKNQRMSTLLGFSTDPSREALLEELVKKGILAQVTVKPVLGQVSGVNDCSLKTSLFCDAR